MRAHITAAITPFTRFMPDVGITNNTVKNITMGTQRNGRQSLTQHVEGHECSSDEDVCFDICHQDAHCAVVLERARYHYVCAAIEQAPRQRAR